MWVLSKFLLIFVFIQSFQAHAQNAVGSYDPDGYDTTRSARVQFLNSQIKQIPESVLDDAVNKMLGGKDDYQNSIPYNIFPPKPHLQLGDHVTQDQKIELISSLEHYYEQKTGQYLEQFGYDAFLSHNIKLQENKAGNSVQENFILGKGDRIVITFRGERSDRSYYTINQDGQIIIPELEPLTAAGLSLESFRDELNTILSESYHDTKAFISMDKIRDISVTLIGEVKTPGRHIISPSDSIFDLLTEAGGVKKSGSLRRIKRIRDGQIETIDLYPLLISEISGKLPVLDLKDGDKVIIPIIGPSFALTGNVQRAGIYELHKDKGNISAAEALKYSGGLLGGGQHRIIIEQINHNGSTELITLNNKKTALLSNNNIITVERDEALEHEKIMLIGAARNAGQHDIDKANKLSYLLKNKTYLKPDAYPYFALIKRYNPETMTRQFIAFSPKDVLHNQYDEALHPHDAVLIFTNKQIRKAR